MKRGGETGGGQEKEQVSLNGAVTAKYWGYQGPEQATARDWRRSAPSPLCENPPDREQNTRRCQDMAEYSGITRQGHIGAKGPAMRKPPKV